MPTKSANNAVELSFINFIPANNTLNFTATPISGGAPIVDATAGVYANAAFIKANSAFDSANNVAPQLAPAFNQANAAFNKANTGVQYDANNTSTGFLTLPIGTTAQRPENAANGAIRYNTTLGRIEGYLYSAGWTSIVSDSYSVEYLIIAGGGAGAGGQGGEGSAAGGGAGGLLQGSLM